jgi:hypothetical protein
MIVARCITVKTMGGSKSLHFLWQTFKYSEDNGVLKGFEDKRAKLLEDLRSLMPQGVTELVILKADRKHLDSIIGSKFMIVPSEENAEDKRKRTIAIANNSSDLGIVAYYQLITKNNARFKYG